MQPAGFLFNYGRQKNQNSDYSKLGQHHRALFARKRGKNTTDNDSQSFYTYICRSTTVHRLVIGPFSRWQMWVGCQH